MTRTLIAAALATALLNASTAFSPAHTEESQSSTDIFGPVSAEKLSHYVKGYNFLVGTFGLPVEYKQYLAQQVSRKSINGAVFISDGWLAQGDDELRQGLDKSGGDLHEADAAAARMMAVLDRLVERLKGLQAYYASRGPLEDNFARGKREDPLVIADFKAALAELQPLSDALDAAIDRRDTAELEVLKASGDQIGYDGGLAMQRAKRLVGLFSSAADTHDPAALARADKMVADLEAALGDLDKQLAAAKAAGDDRHALRNSNYGTAAERLQSLIGSYREMKHSGNPALYQLMITAYNNAVNEVNIGR